MSPDQNGWPDRSRPGVPMNPERDGWHWLHHPEDLRPMVTAWNAELHGWPSGAMHSPQAIVDLGYCYLGPALLPTEVEAREIAAAKAMREACAKWHDETAHYCEGRASEKVRDGNNPDGHLIAQATHEKSAQAIRALPLPAPDALTRALAQARAEERDACALIAVERGAWASNDADAESLVDRLEARGRMDMASEIAAAIRARGKEV